VSDYYDHYGGHLILSSLVWPGLYPRAKGALKWC
jgi:hypothetical protein